MIRVRVWFIPPFASSCHHLLFPCFLPLIFDFDFSFVLVFVSSDKCFKSFCVLFLRCVHKLSAGRRSGRRKDTQNYGAASGGGCKFQITTKLLAAVPLDRRGSELSAKPSNSWSIRGEAKQCYHQNQQGSAEAEEELASEEVHAEIQSAQRRLSDLLRPRQIQRQFQRPSGPNAGSRESLIDYRIF